MCIQERARVCYISGFCLNNSTRVRKCGFFQFSLQALLRIRLLEIARWLSEQLRSLGMTVYGRHDDNDAAVVSFLHPTMNREDLAHLLDARGFAVRTGHHCCQPLMKHFNVTGTSRVSFGIYNTKDDIDYLIDSIDEIIKILL